MRSLHGVLRAEYIKSLRIILQLWEGLERAERVGVQLPRACCTGSRQNSHDLAREAVGCNAGLGRNPACVLSGCQSLPLPKRNYILRRAAIVCWNRHTTNPPTHSHTAPI